MILDSQLYPYPSKIEHGWVDTQRYVVFHELAHDWWGHVAAQDSRWGIWWVEGLTDATAAYALERVYGSDALAITADRGPVEALIADPILGRKVEVLWRRWMLESHGDEDIGGV